MTEQLARRTDLLKADQVAERYGWTSLFPVHSRTSKGRIPHVKRAGDRCCWFVPEWLDSWDRGCELEVVVTAGGDRIVRPKEAT